MPYDGSKLNLEQLLDVSLHYDFPGAIDVLVEKCAGPAAELRAAIADVYTRTDLGVYWNPTLEKAALHVRPRIDLEEYAWGLEALAEKVGAEHVRAEPLTGYDLQDWWVKVAYSPTLRRLGELAQFFPSKDIPGFGGRPIASTVASGLLGAGLGYGAGWLGEKVLPAWAQGEEKSLRKRWAILGGLGGAGLGSTPGLINWHEGRSFNDPTLWRGHPEDGFENSILGPQYKEAVAQYVTKQANLMGTMGGPSFEQLPLIRTDELGRVMWGNQVHPQTTAMTMGAVYGANQMPDPRSRPGVVTPHQMGMFGTMMGAAGGGLKGYITGRAVGYGLGLLTGMPEGTQQTLGRTGAVAGVLNTLVPRLFN
jgi:hypothetical protein